MSPQEMSQHSSIGRPLDPQYFPNLLILILSPVLAVLAGIYSLMGSGDLWQAAQIGFWMGSAVFVTWAISREIDPDNDWSAFLALALVVLAMWLYDFPVLGIFGLGVTLLGMRIVSRIVGTPAKMGDSINLLFLTSLTVIFGHWLLGLVAAATFLMDASMSKPLRQQFYFAGGAILLVLVRGVIRMDETGSLSLPYLLIGLPILVLYMGTILATRKLRVTCDIPEYELDVRRVRAAMSLGLLTALIPALWYGDAGIVAMLPMWASILGVSLYRIPITISEFVQARKVA